MGSYSTLRIGPVTIASIKNKVDAATITLFSVSDKRVRVLNRRAALDAGFTKDDIYEGESLMAVEYVCPRAIAIDRLELQGFTLPVASAAFQAGMTSYLSFLADEQAARPSRGGYYQEETQVISSLTVESWLEAVQRLWANGALAAVRQDVSPEASVLDRYVLASHTGPLGFIGNDVRHFLRLILEIAPEEEPLVYDLTDLVLGAWVDTASDLVEISLQELEESALLSPRRVVLTEGKTDKWILEQSLGLLHPHLADKFTFLDFEGARVGGGAGALANIVKSFVGAGISNRVIAIFDNDAAGRVALNQLAQIAMPRNIVAYKYPDLQLARDYPTVGPTGRVSMDVNGLAGSIELYLGSDVLADEHGDLMPVQWRGYEAQLDCYQGEVLNKHMIQERFILKIATCRQSPNKLAKYDWAGLQAICQVLFSAFHGLDSELALVDSDYRWE